MRRRGASRGLLPMARLPNARTGPIASHIREAGRAHGMVASGSGLDDGVRL